MRHSLLSILIAAAIVFSPAPRAEQLVDTAMIEEIRREGLENSQAYAAFSHLVNVIGPRLTASPEYKAAADWSRDQLARWGLRNARLEDWEFGRGWTLGRFTLEMIDYDVRTHHTNVDTFERVREADLKQGAIILASFAYYAAMYHQRVPRSPAA